MSTSSRRSGWKRLPSEVISAPRIAGAPISFECVVDRIIPMPPLPDHVVWGRVKRIHVRDDLYLSRGRIDVGALGAFGRLAAEYTLVNNIFTTPLPEELVEELGCAACRAGSTGAPPTTRPSTRPNGHRRARRRRQRNDSVIKSSVTAPGDTPVHPLLLIHGFLDDASVWDGLVDSLAGEVGAVRYDLPGFGTRSGSVADACSVTLESLAAEAGEIARRESTDR